MIDLYKYISEGLLSGQEATLSTGTNDSDSILIEDWVNENNEYVHLEGDISNCLTSDNKINARTFNPWYAYGSKELRLPAPDYIKFGKVEHMSMTMQHDVYFEELPHVDEVGDIYLKPFVDKIKLDLSNFPIDKVHEFKWGYEDNDIIRYPKKTEIDTFIMWLHPVNWRCYNTLRYTIGFGKLKGLKCNNLAIPDIIFTENYYDFNKGDGSYIKKGVIEFDSQPGKALLKLYNESSIQFKKLFVYCACDPNHKCYAIKKEKDNFKIAKRPTKLES